MNLVIRMTTFPGQKRKRNYSKFQPMISTEERSICNNVARNKNEFKFLHSTNVFDVRTRQVEMPNHGGNRSYTTFGILAQSNTTKSFSLKSETLTHNERIRILLN